MSEHGDLVQYLTGVEHKLAEQDARIALTEQRVTALEKFAAELDSSQKTVNNQIDVFREAINEEFRRLKAFLADQLRNLGGTRGRS